MGSLTHCGKGFPGATSLQPILHAAWFSPPLMGGGQGLVKPVAAQPISMATAAVGAGATRTTGWPGGGCKTAAALEPAGGHETLDILSLTVGTGHRLIAAKYDGLKFLIAVW